MFIVYDENDSTLKKSNSNRGFSIYHEVLNTESGDSIDYEFINESIVYNPSNATAVEYKNRLSKKVALRELTVVYNDNTFSANESSTSRMTSNVFVMSDSEVVQWKAENTVVDLTKNDLINILKIINNKRTEIIVGNTQN